MKEIGDVLRQQREKRGLTLKDVQTETKIRTRYLEAIEEGDLSGIPGEVYARGFLKSYASYLGLDAAALVQRYKELTGYGPPGANGGIAEPRSISAPAPGSAPLYGAGGSPRAGVPLDEGPTPRDLSMVPRPRRGRWLYPLVAVVVLALIIAGGFYYLGVAGGPRTGEGGSKAQPTPGGTAPGTGGATGTGEQGTGAQAGGSQTGSGGPAGTGSAEASKPTIRITEGALTGIDTLPFLVELSGQTLLRVELKTLARCWVLVNSDDREVYEKIMEAGDSTAWEARDKLTVRLGNPQAIELTVNGQTLATVEASSPRTLEFTVRR